MFCKCLPQIESGNFIFKLAPEDSHHMMLSFLKKKIKIKKKFKKPKQAAELLGKGQVNWVAPKPTLSKEQSKAISKPLPGRLHRTPRKSAVSLEGSPEASSPYTCFTHFVELWMQLLVQLHCNLWDTGSQDTASRQICKPQQELFTGSSLTAAEADLWTFLISLSGLLQPGPYFQTTFHF